MGGSVAKLEATLKFHPLCKEIISFLIEHEGAMDTIQGVAHCWVDGDEVAVKSELECLVSAGVMVAQALTSGVYYSLTPDPKIRAWLQDNRACFSRSRDAAFSSGKDSVM